MFGLLRPCKHTLSRSQLSEWAGHLCGLCIALRDGYGHTARLATNYDAVAVSILVDAQSETSAHLRQAAPCLLRRMRSAQVTDGIQAKFAALLSVILARTKIQDHVHDGDGLLRFPLAARGASAVAGRWDDALEQNSRQLEFDSRVFKTYIADQHAVESQANYRTPVLDVTAPVESITARAFAHTAVLARNQANTDGLARIGQHFGRIAHLADAIADHDSDLESNRWNLLAVTKTSVETARILMSEAAADIKDTLGNLKLVRPQLAVALLTSGLGNAIFMNSQSSKRHQDGDPPKRKPRPRAFEDFCCCASLNCCAAS